MLVRRKRGWEIAERLATPEAAYLSRRELLAAGGFGLAGVAAGWPGLARAEEDPSAALYPAKRNEAYPAGREVTPEEHNINYNNFYEFGMHKYVREAAEALQLRPWEIKVDGLVESEFTIGIDDLLKKVALEERVYRHRCVEAWSMVVPWTGFPLSAFLAIARPLSSAKYVRMETFVDPSIAPGQAQPFYSWPYVEALTMEEAAHDLSFMVTGAYGKPVAKVMGAPIRLHLPWKYGFKSVKSIVRISFVEERPVNWWQMLQGSEYGFWANVNPDVPHPRWSQAQEQVLGTGEIIPTQIFNGYGEFVAGLYKGLENEPLYM